jgi:hypothetical protein
MFLSRVVSDMKIKPGRLAEASAADFSKGFVRCWIASARCAPLLILSDIWKANLVHRQGTSQWFIARCRNMRAPIHSPLTGRSIQAGLTSLKN